MENNQTEYVSRAAEGQDVMVVRFITCRTTKPTSSSAEHSPSTFVTSVNRIEGGFPCSGSLPFKRMWTDCVAPTKP